MFNLNIKCSFRELWELPFFPFSISKKKRKKCWGFLVVICCLILQFCVGVPSLPTFVVLSTETMATRFKFRALNRKWRYTSNRTKGVEPRMTGVQLKIGSISSPQTTREKKKKTIRKGENNPGRSVRWQTGSMNMGVAPPFCYKKKKGRPSTVGSCAMTPSARRLRFPTFINEKSLRRRRYSSLLLWELITTSIISSSLYTTVSSISYFCVCGLNVNILRMTSLLLSETATDRHCWNLIKSVRCTFFTSI
jgi:hypothetical protein